MPWDGYPAIPPTLAQLQAFVLNAGFAPAYLPPASAQLQYALDQAINLVNPTLAAAPGQPDGSYTLYQLAVLNLATHLLVEHGRDVSYPIVAAAPSAGAPWYATLTLAPAAPALAPLASGGTLPSGTVYAQIAYAYAGTVSAPSPEASVVIVGPNGSLSIASPPAAVGATGWYAYAAASSGAEVLQNPAPTAIGAPFDLTSLVPNTVAPAPYAVSPADRVSVAGVSPAAYDAGPGAPFTVYSVSAPGALAQLTYPLVANAAVGYPQATNPGAATLLPGAAVSETFFYQLRQGFGLTRFAPGVVTTASDQGTTAGLFTIEQLRNLQILDLNLVKTPWGRIYLGLAGKYSAGEIWGLT